MKQRDTGEILPRGQMLMLRSIGKCRGPNGMYELLVDQNSRPVIRSELSLKKFLLTWENIVELAVHNGVDDRGAEDV